jgi:hypothetical protein
MKFSNTHWALALILSGALFAVQAQAAIGKSGLRKSPSGRQATKQAVAAKVLALDQHSDDSLSDSWPAGLTHKFGIRR